MPVEKGSKTVKISLTTGESAEIYYYGASVTSWIAGGKERLFLSSKAALDGSKAIRGGVPICWPIFGPPPTNPDETLTYHSKLSQHGFARNYDWTLEHVVMDREEGVSVRFVLDPTPEIIAQFPFPFHLAYVVTLTKHELSTDLHVMNPKSTESLLAAATAVSNAITSSLPVAIGGREPAEQSQGLKFQALLHTYLKVSDSKKVKVEGLRSGLSYIDKTKGGSKETWEGGELTVTKELDRVYYDKGSDDLYLVDGDEKLKFHTKEFPDCTTWNPTETAGARIADMEENGWERYICIEPGYVKEFKTLQPGERWIGQQVLSIQ